MTSGYTISVNGEQVSSANQNAQAGLDGSRKLTSPSGAGVDPRISAATEDTNKNVDANRERTSRDADKADKDGKTLKSIDEKNASKIRGVKDGDTANDGKSGSSGGKQMPQVPMQQQASQPAQTPQVQAPAAQQMPQVQMPQVQMPQAQAPQTALVDPKKLAALILATQAQQSQDSADGKPGPTSRSSSGAAVTPQGKSPIDPSEVSFEKTTQGPLSEQQTADVIDQALTINGVPQNPELRGMWTELYQYMAQYESGNDPNAVNKSDSNAHGETQSDGAPFNSSRGQWQCIPTTFAAYHMGGTSNSIYDPVASAAASINYVMDKYNVSPDGAGLQEFYSARGGGTSSYRGY